MSEDIIKETTKKESPTWQFILEQLGKKRWQGNKPSRFTLEEKYKRRRKLN